MDWFTADLHLKHENILTYCNRPFKTVKDMNNTIIYNINELVKPEDTLYILGDLSIWYNVQLSDVEKLVRKINCKKILILGNHDKFSPFDYIDMGIESVHTHFYHERLKIHLIHDPAVVCGPINMLWLCGHVHGLFKEARNVLNVGVDVWDFKPINEDQIKNWMEMKKSEIALGLFKESE